MLGIMKNSELFHHTTYGHAKGMDVSTKINFNVMEPGLSTLIVVFSQTGIKTFL